MTSISFVKIPDYLLFIIISDIDECAANGGVGDCVNGATCDNIDASFTCNCAAGWEGTLCADGGYPM